MLRNETFEGMTTLINTVSHLDAPRHSEEYDYMAHAINDARELLRINNSLHNDELPWGSSDALIVNPGVSNVCSCFWFDIRTSECFSVTQEDFLTEADVRDYFDLVEAADRKEVKPFVDHRRSASLPSFTIGAAGVVVVAGPIVLGFCSLWGLPLESISGATFCCKLFVVYS